MAGPIKVRSYGILSTDSTEVQAIYVDANGGVNYPQGAEERNPGTANQYGVGVDESTATILDGTSAVSVSSGAPALVFGVMIVTAATTATIVGLKDQNGVAKSLVLTAASGNQYFDLMGMKVDSTFTVTSSVDDDVAVFWRAQ